MVGVRRKLPDLILIVISLSEHEKLNSSPYHPCMVHLPTCTETLGHEMCFSIVFFETRGFTPFPRGCFPSLAKSHVNHVLDRSKAPATLFSLVFYRKESLLNRACR